MERIVRVVLIIWGVAVLLTLILLAVVQFRDEVHAGNLGRHAAPRIFWGGGETEVTLNYTPPAGLVCPPARRAADVLLLIDKSDSMADDNAFPSALAAATAFIDTLDLATSRVGIIVFDDMPELAVQPSHDPEQLRASLSSITPGGTTEIAGTLSYAGDILAELGDQATSGSPLPAIVVLLTDGEANDVTAALAAGRQLKDAGVRLITVGTGQADNAFLIDLASAPADHFEIAEPDQLVALYAGLAEQLQNAVSFDLILIEPLHEALSVIQDSLTPAAAVAGGEIRWDIATVAADGATFAYRATVGGLGLHSVNSREATMSYRDCIAGAVNTSLPGGPQLLVLPPAWLMLLLLFLPLLPLLLMAFFRRQKPQPAKPVFAPTPSLPPPEPLDPTPAWLKRLDEGKILVQSPLALDGDPLAPTLIIGVGPVGRVVLPQIAQALQSRYGTLPTSQVRLLQIDIQPKGSSAPPLERPEFLAAEQWVVLEPDLDEVRRNLDRAQERFGYLNWYQPTAPGYERSRGRMALFYDLKDGASQSRLWQALRAATTGLNRPRLRLVGSTFDDTASGMLVDVARLVQILSRNDVDVELWLSLPVGQEWSTRLNAPRQKVRPAEQVTRTLATLRELERFQRNAVVPFQYVAADHIQTELYGEARMAVIQTLFLFEPPEGSTNVADHLTTLTDALLALLPQNAQQELTQHLTRSAARITALTNTEGIGMVCSLGAFAVRLPLQMLETVLNWRLLHDLLYDTRVGLLPVARLQEDGSYESVSLGLVQESAAEASATRESAAQFVATFRKHTNTLAFRSHVARRVSDILNGEAGEEPTLTRVGGLIHAQNWLQATRTLLLQDGNIDASQWLTALEDQLMAWQRFLLEELRSLVETRFHDAQVTLAGLAAHSGRQWALPPGLDWETYRERVRPWSTGMPTTNTAGEPLLRAARRFGWFVAYNEIARDWQLQLLAPPGHFYWVDEPLDLETFAVARRPDVFVEHLYDLVRPAGQSREEIRTDWVLDVAEGLEPAAWLRQAEPRLRFNSQEASARLGGGLSEAVLLVAPASTRAENLQERLASVSGSLKVALAETKDATAVTVLRIRDRVPLYTLTNYGAEAWERQTVLPSLYVWPGEQKVGEMETGYESFSPIFVGWIERDEPLLRQFATAYLLGLFQLYSGSAYLPVLGQWPAGSVGQALDSLMSSDPSLRPKPLARSRDRERALQELAAVLDKRQQELWLSPGKQTYLRQVEEQLLVPLRRSQERHEQDLALYLQFLINRL